MDYKDALQSITILVDTKEKVWNHIEDVFREQGINYRRQHLTEGDYSFEITIGDRTISFADKVVIERKASLEELSMCFSTDRERFKREFDRIKSQGIYCTLLVENGGFNDIRCHNYKTNMNPQAFEGTLWQWRWRYDYHILFTDKCETAEIIYNQFWYYVRNLFKNQQKIEEFLGEKFSAENT